MRLKSTLIIGLFGVLLFAASDGFGQPGRGITFTDSYSIGSIPGFGVLSKIGASFQDDTLNNAVSLGGLTFPFAGRNYTTAFVSSNGFIVLSRLAATTTSTVAGLSPAGYPVNNLSAIPGNSGPVIAPLWDDLKVDSIMIRTNASIIYIEYRGVHWDHNTAGNPYLAKMVIQLYSTATTTPGVIKFNYLPYNNASAPESWGNVATASASIGIADTCGGDFYSVGSPTNLAVGTSPSWTSVAVSKSIETATINTLGAAPSALASTCQIITLTPTPPSNDQCAGAIALAVSTSNTCASASTYTLINALKNGSANFGCGTANDTNEVWFKFTKPANMKSFTITTDFAPQCRAVTTTMEIYAGGAGCGALGAPIACSTNGGTINALNAVSVLSGATACSSVDYYVRVAGDGGIHGEFQICAHNNNTSDCVANNTIASLPFLQSCNSTCGSLNDYTSGTACGGTYFGGEDYVFKYHTGPSPECVAVNLTNVSGSNPGLFVLSACPNVATGANCLASDTVNVNPSIASVTLPANTDIYIVIDSKGAGSCLSRFDINVTPQTAPVNDDPCGAVTLTVGGGTCTWSSDYSTNCASHTASVANPTCGSLASTGGDIWFTVVVPANGIVTIDTKPGTAPAMTDAAMAVYTAANCASGFAQIPSGCVTGGATTNAAFPNVTLTGLVPLSTIYVRVWSENAVQGNIQFCISSSCIVNDEPCNAILIPVSAGAPVFQTFNDICATTSVGPPANTCATAPHEDVWFRLVVPPSGQLVITEDSAASGSIIDPVMQIYRGTCSSLTTVACNDDGGPDLYSQISGCSFIPGETIWIRIWPYGSRVPGAWRLGAYDPGTTGPNPYQADDPCNVPLDFPVTLGTCNAGSYTPMSINCMTVTGTGLAPTPVNCAPFGNTGWIGGSNDIWVRLVVPPGVTQMNFTTKAGTITDAVMAVYDAGATPGSCAVGALNQIGCDDDVTGVSFMPFLALSGLVPGHVLYVRLWIYAGGTTGSGTLGLCVEAACSSTPPNDDPCTATTLAVGQTCNYLGPFTTVCSTPSAGIPAPGCANYLAGTTGDVWFKAVVPNRASPQLAIDIRGASLSDGGMAIYTATNCSTAVALLSCDDNSSANTNMPYILQSAGLTANSTIYIRVWAKGGTGNGTFDICVYDPCPTGPPANDNVCNGAQPISLGVTYSGSNACATDVTFEPAAPACWTAGILNTVWYTFTAPASGQVNITTTAGTLTNTQIALYQYSGFCNSLTPFAGTNCNNDYTLCGVTQSSSQIIASGLVAGNTYYIMVDGYQNLTGSFYITVYDASVALPYVAQQDCPLPSTICSQVTQVGNPGFTGSGNYCDLPSVVYGCVPAAGNRENNEAFYTFTIGTVGDLLFDISPSSVTNYDWVLWGPFCASGCSGGPWSTACARIVANTLTPIACNWSTTPGVTGISSSGTYPGTPTDPFSPPIPTVNPGEQYLLMINNTNSTNTGFTLDFLPGSPVAFSAQNPLNWTGGNGTAWNDPLNWGGCGSPDCSTGGNIITGPFNQPFITSNQNVENITINAGATLTLGAGVTLQVCGNFTNNGSLVADPTSTVEFIGTGNQSISGNLTGTNAFGNLKVNKPSGRVNLNTAFVDTKRDVITVNNTSVLNLNSKTLRIGRDLVNFNGNVTLMNAGTSTIAFIGSAPQTFTNTGSSLVLGNVSMLQPAASTLTLSPGPLNNLIIGPTGILTMTSGSILTGNDTVVVQNTAAAAVTSGTIVSYIDGYLRRYLAAGISGSFDFPVGNSAKGYERANLNFTTAPTTSYDVAARFLDWGGANLPLVNGPPPMECGTNDYTLKQALNHGYWTFIQSSPTPTGTYTLQLYNRSQSNFSSAGLSGVVQINTNANQINPNVLLMNTAGLGLAVGQIVYGPFVSAFYQILPAGAGSNTITVTGSMTGLVPGMYIADNNYFAPGTTISSIAGNVITLSTPTIAAIGPNEQVIVAPVITAITPTSVTLSAPTMSWPTPVPSGTTFSFATAAPTGRYAFLTCMKDISNNWSGNWSLEGVCPCANPACTTPLAPIAKRCAIDASTTGLSTNFASIQFNTVLPIELISFTADRADETTICQWETASEINNDHFEVERSYDGEHFDVIGIIAGYGAGTTTHIHSYSLVDKDPCNGIVYYRLKQVDIDYQFSYSAVVAINCMKSDKEVVLYPNPAHNELTYSFYEDADQIVDVQIVDMYGKLAKWERASTRRGYNSLHVQIDELPTGVYTLRIHAMDNSDMMRQARFTKD